MSTHPGKIGGIHTTSNEIGPSILDWGFYCHTSAVNGSDPTPVNTFDYWEGLIGKYMPIKPLHLWADQINWTTIQALFDVWRVHSKPLLLLQLFDTTSGFTTVELKKWLPTTFTNGDHDVFLNALAANIAAWGHPMYLRIWPESNSSLGVMPNIAPWIGITHDENNSVLSDEVDWVAGWKYIVDLFDAAGCDNVEWVWSHLSYPAGSPGNNPVSVAELYPGDAYVDVMGFEMYPSGWALDPTKLNPVLDPLITVQYAELCAIHATKPFWVAESGALIADNNAYREAWIHNCLSAYELQQRFSRVAGMFLWDSWPTLGFQYPDSVRDITVNCFKNGLYKNGY